VELAHPELFGRDGSISERITVQASFSDFEPGWQDKEDLISMIIPKTKVKTASPDEIDSVGDAASSAQAATVATLGANIALSGAMSQVWGMINGL